MSVTVQVKDSPILRHRLLELLGMTGTVTSFDPRWTLPYHTKMDDGRLFAFAEDNLEVLEP